MPLVRWTPFRELMDMPREMRRMFGGSAFPMLEEPAFEGLGLAPAMDIYARGSDMVLRLELPGIKIEDLDISLTEHTLHISGERRQDKEIKEDDYYRRERSYGRFERSVPLPEKVAETDIDANYADGILEVTVKGAVESVPSKHIEVKTGKGEAARIEPKGPPRPGEGPPPPPGGGPPPRGEGR